MKKIIFVIVILLSSVSVSAQKYDISKTWQEAAVFVPGSFWTKSITNVEVKTPMPTIVFMHGCGGIDQHGTQWAQFLKSQGYVVVMPDSYAMAGRVKNCNPATSTRNLGLVPVRSIRPAEVIYAVSQLKQQPWVDKNNIFIMGHSEGGMAAALAPELGVNAIIISGYTCQRGVNSNANTPVLAINYEVDPYFINKPSTCKDNWGRRPYSKQIILLGKGHQTFSNSESQREVVNFLKQHSR